MATLPVIDKFPGERNVYPMWQCSRIGEGSRKMCMVATTAGPKLLLFDAVVHLAHAVLRSPTSLHRRLRLALGRTGEVT